MFQSFKEIIDLWPSRRVMAEEIGCPIGSVLKWVQRDTIPDEYWLRLLSAAGKRGLIIALVDLARLAEKRLEAKEPKAA